MSCVQGIAKWLSEVSQSDAGAELDLSRANDNIDHEIGTGALQRCEVPSAVVFTALAAWNGPRHLSLAGEIAAAVWVARGLPQGDSVAPAGMCASLIPWQLNCGQAYMDDRSLTNTTRELVQDDLAFTEKFDQEVGFTENQGKRQLWSRDDDPPQLIEHLGVQCRPTDSEYPIIPRKGWQQVYQAIETLGSIPGGSDVRERLAVSYIRPLWYWASPLLAPVPEDVPRLLHRAIVRSSSEWWCQGRWWAQRILSILAMGLHYMHSSLWMISFSGRSSSRTLCEHTLTFLE